MPNNGLGRALLYILLSCTAVSCGILTQRATPKLQPSDVGYGGNAEPLFYYIEGLKSSRLYNDQKRAITLFERAISLDSTHSPSYYEAANAMAETDPEKALIYSEQATKIDTTNRWYQGQLGQLMLATKNYNKALETYEQLVRLSPHNPDIYRVLAALYEQNKQPFTAIGVLDSAEYKLGRIEELSAYKRQLLIGVRLYDKAIAETMSLINDYPYKYDNYVIMAELYGATGKDSLALANYAKATELNATGVDLLVSMNEYHKKKGDQLKFLSSTKQIFAHQDVDLNTKISFFKEITKDREYHSAYFFQINELASTLLIKYPNNYEVIDLYAGNLIAYGTIEQALKLYKEYINDSTTNIKAFNSILEIEAYLNRPDSVAKYSDIALQAFPNNSELYLRKGSIALHLKHQNEAMTAYRNALKYASNDSTRSVVMGIFGDLYQQQGKKGKRDSYYNRALRLWADNSAVLNNYAYFMSIEERDLEKALKMAERVIELEGSNPTYLDTQAWILFKLGRYDQAKKIMQQAISLDRTNSSELLIHYGDILYAMDEYFMASIYWKKALEAGYDATKIEQRLKQIEGK